jgi:MFS family permease
MDAREREAEERRQSAVTDTPERSTATNGAGGNGGGSGAPPPPAVEVGGMGMGRGGGGAPLSLKNLRTFSSFKSPVFRLYYGAMLGQMAGMNMQMFARTLLVFRLTDSATALGVMAMANAVPMLFFSLFGGVMAERVQKKYVLLWGQVASVVVSLVVALSLSLGFMSMDRPNSWVILIGASLVQGTIMGLMMPSRQAIIADIVGGEQLMNAVALNTLGMNSLRLMAPAVAGFLVDFFGIGEGIGGFASVYYVMTAMYIVSVAFIVLMPKTGTISLQGRGAMADVIDGFKYVRRDPTIFVLLIITLLTVLFSMSYMFLLPVFTERVWDVSASRLGLLISVSGVGAMAGSIVLASLPNKKRGLMLMVGSLILGLSLLAFSISPSYNIALITIVFVGLGQTARMTLGNTLLQYYVKDEYRGRVMSMMMMEFGLTSFIVGITGWLADIIGTRGGYDGVQWVVGGLAFMLVVLSVYVIAFVPRIRRLD